jgi:hypothetical protein
MTVREWLYEMDKPVEMPAGPGDLPGRKSAS